MPLAETLWISPKEHEDFLRTFLRTRRSRFSNPGRDDGGAALT